MADPFDPGSSDPFGPQGPIPKPGQTVPPPNLPEQFRSGREQATQLGAELTGVFDVRQVLSGETPMNEAIAGAIPMMMGGPEARAAERAAAKAAKSARGLFPAMAERYPEVGPPILRDAKTRKPITGKTQAQADKMVEAGTAFWGKQLTPEAEAVQKARLRRATSPRRPTSPPAITRPTSRCLSAVTSTPPYKSTVDILPAKPETIKKYMAMASNPEGVARLQAAFEKGLTLPNANNWYFMHQLEQEFIKEYGELGPEMFKRRVADAMAATTGGADPAANVMTAHYGNYIAARGEDFPSEAHQVPFPIGGGKYGVMPNLAQYKKMLMEGGTGVTAANPKRYNFSSNILGNPWASTIDEQMARLFDPKLSQPEHYGPYQQVINDLAERNGVDPRYFQEVAWSGAKSMREPGYVPKPLIQEYNEAIERTSRITGVPPAEVVRRGIVRAEMPLYGAGGIIGASQVMEEEEQQQPTPPMPGRQLQIDPAAAGFHAGGPGVARMAPAKSASHLIDTAIEDRRLSEEAAVAFGAGAE